MGYIFCIEEERDGLPQKLKITSSSDEQLVSDKDALRNDNEIHRQELHEIDLGVLKNTTYLSS